MMSEYTQNLMLNNFKNWQEDFIMSNDEGCIPFWYIALFFFLFCLAFFQVTIKNIERELICPACKELFTHPLILPCQHSICHKCVKEILYFTFEDSFNDAASETSNQSSPRLRISSPSMDRIDRASRSGMYKKPCLISTKFE